MSQQQNLSVSEDRGHSKWRVSMILFGSIKMMEERSNSHAKCLSNADQIIIELTKARIQNSLYLLIQYSLFLLNLCCALWNANLTMIIKIRSRSSKSCRRSDNSAIPIADGYVMSRNGNRIPKPTTRGWSLLVSWKDGSSNWVPLKDLKDAYPVQIAEYFVANKIANEPAFNWWVHTVLRKQNRIVAKVKRYSRTTHKFGI